LARASLKHFFLVIQSEEREWGYIFPHHNVKNDGGWWFDAIQCPGAQCECLNIGRMILLPGSAKAR
jgi:hypothetical protein